MDVDWSNTSNTSRIIQERFINIILFLFFLLPKSFTIFPMKLDHLGKIQSCMPKQGYVSTSWTLNFLPSSEYSVSATQISPNHAGYSPSPAPNFFPFFLPLRLWIHSSFFISLGAITYIRGNVKLQNQTPGFLTSFPFLNRFGLKTKQDHLFKICFLQCLKQRNWKHKLIFIS